MSIPPIFLIVIAFIAFAIIASIISHRMEMKRRRLLAEFAAQMGWAFDHHHDSSFSGRFQRFGSFQRGHSRWAFNTMRGTVTAANADGEAIELRTQAGDFHYKKTSGSGKNRRTKTYRISYLMIEAPGAGGRDLQVRAENLGDKMKGALGFDDIDFESVEFSDRFWVTSSDKRFAYDVIHPRMMEFLMNGNTPRIEIGHGVLCLAGSGSRWEPFEFRSRLQWCQQFFAHWPRHLEAARGRG